MVDFVLGQPAGVGHRLQHFDGAESRREVSPEFRLDLAAWLAALPEPLREYAELAVDGKDRNTIQRMLGISKSTAERYRSRLYERWQEYIAV